MKAACAFFVLPIRCAATAFLSFHGPRGKTLVHRGARGPRASCLEQAQTPAVLCRTCCLAFRTVLCHPCPVPWGTLSWLIIMEEPGGGTYLAPLVTAQAHSCLYLEWSNILSYKHPVENPVKILKTTMQVNLAPDGKPGQCAVPWLQICLVLRRLRVPASEGM